MLANCSSRFPNAAHSHLCTDTKQPLLVKLSLMQHFTLTITPNHPPPATPPFPLPPLPPLLLPQSISSVHPSTQLYPPAQRGCVAARSRGRAQHNARTQRRPPPPAPPDAVHFSIILSSPSARRTWRQRLQVLSLYNNANKERFLVANMDGFHHDIYHIRF